MPNFGVYMTKKIDPFAHALQGGGGVVGPDHAFATLVHENPTSRFFFSPLSRIPLFVSKIQTLKRIVLKANKC